jgi:hypothetical protein
MVVWGDRGEGCTEDGMRKEVKRSDKYRDFFFTFLSSSLPSCHRATDVDACVNNGPLNEKFRGNEG